MMNPKPPICALVLGNAVLWLFAACGDDGSSMQDVAVTGAAGGGASRMSAAAAAGGALELGTPCTTGDKPCAGTTCQGVQFKPTGTAGFARNCPQSDLSLPCLGTATGMYCSKSCTSDSDCAPSARPMKCVTACLGTPSVIGRCWSSSDYEFLIGRVCDSR